MNLWILFCIFHFILFIFCSLCLLYNSYVIYMLYIKCYLFQFPCFLTQSALLKVIEIVFAFGLAFCLFVYFLPTHEFFYVFNSYFLLCFHLLCCSFLNIWVEWLMLLKIILLFENKNIQEFPGSPVVRTLCAHCQGPKFSPWSGN